MNIKDKIKDVVDSQLSESEFLVDVIVKGAAGNQKLIILLDGDQGITIERCAEISRIISSYLEENDLFETAYTLEVSSPGLDHPLKLKRQYSKNLGRNLRITTSDNQQVEGKLTNILEDKIEVELKGKNGIEEKNIISIPFKNIDKTMVLVSFSKKG